MLTSSTSWEPSASAAAAAAAANDADSEPSSLLQGLITVHRGTVFPAEAAPAPTDLGAAPVRLCRGGSAQSCFLTIGLGAAERLAGIAVTSNSRNVEVYVSGSAGATTATVAAPAADDGDGNDDDGHSYALTMRGTKCTADRPLTVARSGVPSSLAPVTSVRLKLLSLGVDKAALSLVGVEIFVMGGKCPQPRPGGGGGGDGGGC